MPISKTPFADKLTQAVPTKRALWDKTDLYYRSFDQNQSDFYLFKEWEREFDQFVTNQNMPSLSLVSAGPRSFWELCDRALWDQHPSSANRG